MANDMDLSRAEEVEAFIARTPLAQELGIRCEVMGDEMTAIMPFHEKLIGNVTIRALHGGAIAAFLELTAQAQVFLVTEHLAVEAGYIQKYFGYDAPATQAYFVGLRGIADLGN